MPAKLPPTKHPELVNPLRKLESQVGYIIQLVNRDRGPVELVDQIHGLERSVSRLKRALIKSHLDECLENISASTAATPQTRKLVREFKELSKFL